MRLGGEVVEHGDAERGVEGVVAEGNLKGHTHQHRNENTDQSTAPLMSLTGHAFLRAHRHTDLQHVAGKHLRRRKIFPSSSSPFLLLPSRRTRQEADGAVAPEGERSGVEVVPTQRQVLAVAAANVRYDVVSLIVDGVI